MNMIRKILRWIGYLLTFGYNSYFLYKKEEKKLQAVYEGINVEKQRIKEVYNLLKDKKLTIEDALDYMHPSRINNTLKTIQEARGVWQSVRDDLRQLKAKL